MPNLGEEICGEYLQHFKNCEFISYNVATHESQGEIDVIGIDIENQYIYICEVAIHTAGLQYVTNNRPDDYNRFVSKFEKDIEYVKNHFSNYSIKLMLWSSIVKIGGKRAKYNTLFELNRVVKYFKDKYQYDLELVINHDFKKAIQDLKEYTDTQTSEFKSNVMRMFQIERSLDRHIAKLDSKKDS